MNDSIELKLPTSLIPQCIYTLHQRNFTHVDLNRPECPAWSVILDIHGAQAIDVPLWAVSGRAIRCGYHACILTPALQ